MTLLRCVHAPVCRKWVRMDSVVDAERAMAEHLRVDHSPGAERRKQDANLADYREFDALYRVMFSAMEDPRNAGVTPLCHALFSAGVRAPMQRRMGES